MHNVRTSVVLLALLPALLLACDDDDPAAPEGAASDDESSSLVFRTIVKIDGINWFNRLGEGVTRFGEDTGVEVSVVGPAEADATQQIPLIEAAIDDAVDAICAVPVDPAQLDPVLLAAREAGIKVVTHEAASQASADYDVEAFDNEAYGAGLMDELAERMGEEGEYAVFVGTLGSETHNSWVDAAIARQREAYPNMTLVGEKNETHDDPETAYEAARALLDAHPDLEGFQGSGSTDVAGIGRAVAEAGLEDETVVVGTSLPSIAGDLFGTGAIDLIGFWDPAAAGEACNAVALKLVNGDEINTGADLGVAGYEDVVVEGKVITGDAAVYITVEEADDYPF